MTPVDLWVDLLHSGCPEYLRELLIAAPDNAAARDAIAELGRFWREDGAWRGQLKQIRGWNGHPTAWVALAAFIEVNANGKPWWKILDFADGRDVGDAAEFFAGTK